ncbi:MAG: PD40 domain-containing protein [Anaerolineae bacterium]|nr:PD40 domain-containing protein [Anaerolineae bacterium]
MRRLLTWIATLTTCLCIPIFGVRVLRDVAVPESCVQLLDPVSGSVLTVDASTGHALMDARHAFPLPLVPRPYERDLFFFYQAAVSPDQRYTVDVIGEASTLDYQFLFGRRSEVYRRWLTHGDPGLYLAWSPDSRYVAFTESRIPWGSAVWEINLAVMKVEEERLVREEIATPVSATVDVAIPVWSPDSSMIAMWGSSTTGDLMLFLRSPDSDQSTTITFPQTRLVAQRWSPDSQRLLVATTTALFIFNPDGQLLHKVSLLPNFSLQLGWAASYVIQWSPDGQYIALQGAGRGEDLHQYDIISMTGEHILDTPISAMDAIWSTQSTTLLYYSQAVEQPGIFTVDTPSGTITPLVEETPTFLAEAAPDGSAWAIFTSDRSTADPNSTLHVIALDTLLHTTPFGILPFYDMYSVEWSPDSQHIAVSYAENGGSLVRWARQDGSAAQTFFVPDLDVYARWWNNDLMMLGKPRSMALPAVEPHWQLFDTRTKASWGMSAQAGEAILMWQSDDYYVLKDSSLTLYRVRDGKPLWTMPANDGQIEVFITPDESAVLIARSRNSNVGGELNLLTANGYQRVNRTNYFTQPAWSADGRRFAFMEYTFSYNTWPANRYQPLASLRRIVKIMDREGALLHEFALPAYAENIPYEYTRWTDCS